MVRGCRPSFYVVFWTSRCLKSRTVVSQTCPMCSMYRTLVNFSLPRACPGRPLGRGPENPILEAFQNSYNPFILSLYGSLILGSGGYGTTLGGSGPPAGRVQAGPWAEVLKIRFWRPSRTHTIPLYSPYMDRSFWAPAAMGPLWEGLGHLPA